MLLFFFVGWHVLKRRIESVPAGTFRELRNYPVRSRFQRVAVFGPCETLSGFATRDILQSLTAESFGDFGQGGSLRIRQPEAGRQVSSEDAILGRQVLIAQQQFLIDETCHE